MKKGWPTKTLGEVCEVFADGDWVESKDQSSEGIRLIQTGNVGEGVFKDRAEKARYISEATFKRLRCTEIVEGDCLVSRLPDPVGRSCILPDTGERMITAVDCTILRFNPKQLLPTFFNLYSQSDDYLTTVAKECTGTTRNRISRSNLGLTPIPVPPLAEQQRIVGLLDEAFEGLATAKANAEKNLQNARALFESHLQSVFTQRGPGWVEKSIGELCERLHQGLNTAGEKVKFYDSGYPIIQTRNIDDGVVELDSKMKFMSEEDWQLYKDKYRPEIGDVFFTNIGTIGKTAIVTTDRDYLIHWNIFKLRPLLGKVTSEFLRYTLEQLTLSGYFEKLQKGGTVDFVTKKMISEALILLPAIAEQKTIVAKLDDLREETQRLARLYERKLAALEALKKSLLHQAFAGEL